MLSGSTNVPGPARTRKGQAAEEPALDESPDEDELSLFEDEDEDDAEEEDEPLDVEPRLSFR